MEATWVGTCQSPHGAASTAGGALRAKLNAVNGYRYSMPYMHIIIGVAVIVATIVVFIIIARTMGVQCAFCGGRIITLSCMSDAERQRILAYFRKVEERKPYLDFVFVCLDCHRVGDDRTDPNVLLQGMFRCKACGKLSVLDDSMRCENCSMRYRWTTLSEFGKYQFLLPYDSPVEE